MSVEEWDRRQLCSDGGCTGVIGPTGQCKTCGRAAPNWGDERKRGMRNTTDAPPLATKPKPTVSADDDIVPSAPAALGAGLAVGGWNSRQLCSDGGCIGLLGPDGACKVCGTRADGVIARGASASEAEYEDDGDFEDDDEYEDDDGDDGGYEDDEDDEPDEGDGDDGVIAAKARANEDALLIDAARRNGLDVQISDGEQDIGTINGKAATGVMAALRLDAQLAAAADDLAASARSGDIVGLPPASNVAVSPTTAELLAAHITDEPEDRLLCSDGACVGVIGDNGLCKVCGKPPEPA